MLLRLPLLPRRKGLRWRWLRRQVTLCQCLQRSQPLVGRVLAQGTKAPLRRHFVLVEIAYEEAAVRELVSGNTNRIKLGWGWGNFSKRANRNRHRVSKRNLLRHRLMDVAEQPQLRRGTKVHEDTVHADPLGVPGHTTRIVSSVLQQHGFECNRMLLLFGGRHAACWPIRSLACCLQHRSGLMITIVSPDSCCFVRGWFDHSPTPTLTPTHTHTHTHPHTHRHTHRGQPSRVIVKNIRLR